MIARYSEAAATVQLYHYGKNICYQVNNAVGPTLPIDLCHV